MFLDTLQSSHVHCIITEIFISLQWIFEDELQNNFVSSIQMLGLQPQKWIPIFTNLNITKKIHIDNHPDPQWLFELLVSTVDETNSSEKDALKQLLNLPVDLDITKHSHYKQSDCMPLILKTNSSLNPSKQNFIKILQKLNQQSVNIEYCLQSLMLKDALVVKCTPAENLKKLSPNTLLSVTLSKIMTCEYENGLCCYENPSLRNTNNPTDDWSDDDEDKDDNSSSDSIHPVDNLLALIHCSDNLLRQTILSKLTICQVATPILLPNPLDNSVTFLIWAMRSVVKVWNRLTVNNEEILMERSLVSYPCPIVSFLRIGTLTVSKSNIINHVIGSKDVFFFRNCRQVKFQKQIANGMVDLCYFLPGNKDCNFANDAVLFLNLHGDVRDFDKQSIFLQKVSHLIVLLVNEYSLDEKALQLISKLCANYNQLLVFIQNCDDGSRVQLQQSVSNIRVCRFKKGKQIDGFKKPIQNTIANMLDEPSNCRFVSLKDHVRTAQDCGILVDENDKTCSLGFKVAEKVLVEVNKVPADKAKLMIFPLQGPKGWQKWAEIDKRQHKEFGDQTMDLEKYNAKLKAEKMSIRQELWHACKNLTSPLKEFLNALLTLDIRTKMYFLTWLTLLLGEQMRCVLADLFKNKQKSGEQNKARHNASIGLEHFFREVCQLYETLACLKKLKNQDRVSQNTLKLPYIMAEIITYGGFMEMMDGDASHVPLEWVTAIFNELQKLHEGNTLYTISIIGIQSTGKSTLLNTMFGLNFNVSAGRCTRGAFIQLLTFDKSSKKRSQCDHVLLIDTEGLQAPELQFIGQEHDNTLATFVIGLADIAIINMGGESQNQLKDILHTVSHALIRMEKIELHPRCKFVHQHITAIGAKQKTEDGRKVFLQKLDTNIQEACKLELCVGKYKHFSDVIAFDDEKDVLYFNTLWTGNPPMAKINPKYTESARCLKYSITEGNVRHFSFTVFSSKVEVLWNAVLREQFLFSFRNTLEIAARKELDEKFSEWNADFQQALSNWEQKVYDRYACNYTKTLKTELLEEFSITLEGILTKLLEKKRVYFDESTYKEILPNLTQKSDKRIQKFKDKCMKEATKYCKQQDSIQKSRAETEKTTTNICKKINALAESLDCEEEIPEDELIRIFDEKWTEWLENITTIECKTLNDIQHVIIEELRKKLSRTAK